MGIVKILSRRKLPVSLSLIIARSARTLAAGPRRESASRPGVEKQVLEFLLDRARFVLKERGGLAYDEINAALAAGADDLVDAHTPDGGDPSHPQDERILSRWPSRSSASERFSKRPGREAGGNCPRCARNYLPRRRSASLHARGCVSRKEAEQHKRAGQYPARRCKRSRGCGPRWTGSLIDVMVMAEDEQIRKNRLTLLSGCSRNFRRSPIFRRS